MCVRYRRPHGNIGQHCYIADSVRVCVCELALTQSIAEATTLNGRRRVFCNSGTSGRIDILHCCLWRTKVSTAAPPTTVTTMTTTTTTTTTTKTKTKQWIHIHSTCVKQSAPTGCRLALFCANTTNWHTVQSTVCLSLLCEQSRYRRSFVCSPCRDLIFK